MTRAGSDIAALLRSQFGASPPPRVGVAVSGGGDSLALLHLLKSCFDGEPVEILAATVDHGLRKESAEEAKWTAEVARGLGLRHEVLIWEDGPEETGNLQEQARHARYSLLTNWARRNGIPILTLGHTADDQAETVLMRLSRAGGVNGLAGIPQRRTLNGVTLLRPLLEVRREALRSYLRDEGHDWIDDPSNDDSRFERVRFRKALENLAELGITVPALATVAQNMSKARKALDWHVFLAARDIARFEAGAMVFDLRKFRTLPDEIAHRLLQQAIQWISGNPYPARRLPMIEAAEQARRGGSATLSGCRIMSRKCGVWVCREFAAVEHSSAPSGGIWDGRWRVFAGEFGQSELRPLGAEGMKQCPEWRSQNLPGPVLEVTPALWQGGKLIAAPLAGYAKGTTAELVNSEEEFFASLLSH
ncbi:PP-loop family protein [Roseobacter sp. SK209-2-6]|uniref:tRNA lysidine(34) synthetase TilS n=1 Tax=Roseobacter sp. SK209-2-6 TaxID=388739 RepID=UPI0000F3C471|nr:tRNA lysidine(34) synthetase TilS [Roseobacter sp. SK209-2-6]EBA18518.1 PP-loop family protein [Roseobacter sp. SK209-2-6]